MTGLSEIIKRLSTQLVSVVKVTFCYHRTEWAVVLVLVAVYDYSNATCRLLLLSLLTLAIVILLRVHISNAKIFIVIFNCFYKHILM